MRIYADAVLFLEQTVDAVSLVAADIGKSVAAGAEKVIVIGCLSVVADGPVADVKTYRIAALAKHTEIAVDRRKAQLGVVFFKLIVQPLGTRMVGNAAEQLHKRLALL